jgi:hypothetical protein
MTMRECGQESTQSTRYFRISRHRHAPACAEMPPLGKRGQYTPAESPHIRSQKLNLRLTFHRPGSSLPSADFLSHPLQNLV